MRLDCESMESYVYPIKLIESINELLSKTFVCYWKVCEDFIYANKNGNIFIY